MANNNYATVNFLDPSDENHLQQSSKNKSSSSSSSSSSSKQQKSAGETNHMESVLRIIGKLSHTVRDLEAKARKQQAELNAARDKLTESERRVAALAAELRGETSNARSARDRISNLEECFERLDATSAEAKAAIESMSASAAATRANRSKTTSTAELNVSTSDIVSILAESLAVRIAANNTGLYGDGGGSRSGGGTDEGAATPRRRSLGATIVGKSSRTIKPTGSASEEPAASASAASVDSNPGSNGAIVDLLGSATGSDGWKGFIDPKDDAVIASLMRYNHCINLDGCWPGELFLKTPLECIPATGTSYTKDTHYGNLEVAYPDPLSHDSKYVCVMGSYLDLMPRPTAGEGRSAYAKDYACVYFPLVVLERYRSAIELGGYTLDERTIVTDASQQLVAINCRYGTPSGDAPALAVLANREDDVRGTTVARKSFDSTQTIEAFYETEVLGGDTGGGGVILKGCVFGEFGVQKKVAKGADLPAGATVKLVFKVLGFHAFYDSTQTIRPIGGSTSAMALAPPSTLKKQPPPQQQQRRSPSGGSSSFLRRAESARLSSDDRRALFSEGSSTSWSKSARSVSFRD